MCLILFSYQSQPGYRLVVAANRDEFYDRPTRPLTYWGRNTGILAGRDLESNGTWLGVTTNGRFAAVTNYREPHDNDGQAPSRGLLVSGFLSGLLDPEQYLSDIYGKAHQYHGFNLLVGDRKTLYYYSNRGDGIVKLDSGIYGLSNHLMNTPWPKVEKGLERFQAILKQFESQSEPGLLAPSENLLDMLDDRTCSSDHMLPDTGVGKAWERILSPIFVHSENYGTRSSTVIWIDDSGRITFWERAFDPKKEGRAESDMRMYTFQIKS